MSASTLPNFKGTGEKIQQRITAVENTLSNFPTNGTASKAVMDDQGNVISTTYAKKNESLQIQFGTADMVAGETPLESGTLYFVYG